MSDSCVTVGGKALPDKTSTRTRLRGAFLPVLWMSIAAIGLILGSRGGHSAFATIGAVLLFAWGFEQLVLREVLGHRRSTSA